MFRIMQAHARARNEGRELRWLVVDVFGGRGVKTGRRSEGQEGVAAEGQRGEHLVQMSSGLVIVEGFKLDALVVG